MPDKDADERTAPGLRPVDWKSMKQLQVLPHEQILIVASGQAEVGIFS